MNPARILLILVGVLGLGAGAMLLLGGDDIDPTQVTTTAREGGRPGSVGVADAMVRGADEGDDRTEMERGAAAALGLPTLAQTGLQVRGRVTDKLGNPIARARVQVLHRQDFMAAFTQAREAGGNAPQGGRGGMREMFQGMQGQRGPGGRGPGGEISAEDRQRFEEMRARFQAQPVADAVLTGADGTYALSGKAYEAADLTIVATHESYAPAIERRQWQAAMGELGIDDLVLQDGLVITGVVVDDGQVALAGAEVRWERANPEDANQNPFGNLFGGNQDNGRGGRNGGRGGFGGGPGGGFGGRRGWGGADPLADLVMAKTDNLGTFRLGPVPAGAFQLVASAQGHLDAHSRVLEATDGQPVAEQRLVAVKAAQVSGIVRDPDGKPIANAMVQGEVSREALMAQFRQQRENAMAQQSPGAPGGQGQDGGGRRPRGGDNGEGPRGGDPARMQEFARMRETVAATETVRTNDKGEFTFQKLPKAQLKLTATHRRFLEQAQEPVDATGGARVEITMQRALSVSGTVVDAGTGQPVLSYGITARRVDGGQQNQDNPFAGFGQRGGRGGQNGQGNPGGPAPAVREVAAEGNTGRGGRGGRTPDPARQAEREQAMQQAQAERAAAEKARAAWLEAMLGPGGRMPGRTPEPTAHQDGTFTVDGLQVGEYVLDIDAPGYVRMATQPFQVEAGQPVTGMTVRVATGSRLAGTVVLADGTPVQRATVELFLPEPPQGVTLDENQRSGGGRGGRGGPGGFGGFGGPGGGMRVARAVTGADGAFELDPVFARTLRLRVQAEDLVDFEDPAVALPGPGQTRTMKITMVGGGRVHGVVSNLPKGVSARVTLVHTGNNSRHGANVDLLTGEYSIEGLPAGGYFASINQRGGDEETRRAQLAAAIAQRDKQFPDVMVGNGAEVRHDLVAGQEALGTLSGQVRFNGAAATGVQVRLQRRDPNAAAAAPGNGNGGGRGGRGPGGQGGNQNTPEGRMAEMAQQLLRGTVGADGSFQITAIPPGTYQMEVSRGSSQVSMGQGGFGGRGGRGGPGGGNSVLQRQDVTITAYSVTTVQVDLLTSQLEIRVTTPPVEGEGNRLRVMLALASEAGTTPANEWRRLPSLRMLMVRDGTTGPQPVPPGTWRYDIGGRGLTSATGELVVVPGQPAFLNVTLDKAPEPAPGETPPGNGAGGNAPGGNGPGNGGQRGRGPGGQGNGQGGQGGGRRGG